MKRAFFPLVLAAIIVCPLMAQDNPEMVRVDLGARITLEYDATLPPPDGARLRSLTELWRHEHPSLSGILIAYHYVTYDHLKDITGIDDTGGILLGTSRSVSFGPAEFAFGERTPLQVDVRRHDIWFWQVQDRVVLHELYHLFVTSEQPLLIQNVSQQDLEKHIDQLALLLMCSDAYKDWLTERPWVES